MASVRSIQSLKAALVREDSLRVRVRELALYEDSDRL